MLMLNLKDMYQMISGMVLGEFCDWGSKFIVYVYLAYNEEEWKVVLEEVCKFYFKACYYCYVYWFGLDQNNFCVNDDGEFSGIVGWLILGQIDSFGLIYVIVIVI